MSESAKLSSAKRIETRKRNAELKAQQEAINIINKVTDYMQ